MIIIVCLNMITFSWYFDYFWAIYRQLKFEMIYYCFIDDDKKLMTE